MGVLILWLLLGWAEARDVRVCGQWTPDLNEAGKLDGDGVDDNGDGIDDNDKADRLTDNSPLAAHGLTYLAQYRLSGGSWTFASAGYLEVAGPTGGCTPVLTLPTDASGDVDVRMKAYSSFLAGGSGMAVYDNPTSETLGVATSSVTTVTSSSGPRAEVDLGSGDARIDTAIIVAWALDRENGGTSSLGYDIYASTTGTGQGGHDFENRTLKVGDESSVRRIVHELGHAVTANMPGMGTTATGEDAWLKTYEWRNIEIIDASAPGGVIPPESVCEVEDWDPSIALLDRHFTTSDEATSAAIVEALAHYYLAQTVNRLDEGDCYIQGNQDWDHDFDLDENAPPAGASQWYSCDGLPRPYSLLDLDPGELITDHDYWSDVCEQDMPYPESLTDEYSIAAEYDWLRGFWDLDTDEGLTFLDIGAVFAVASPHDWWAGPSAPLAEHADLPFVRMSVSAIAEGFSGEWASQAPSNGMHR